MTEEARGGAGREADARERVRRADRHPLDDVVWNALTGAHARFAEGDSLALRYPRVIAPFAATRDGSEKSFRSLLALLGAEDRVALVTTDKIAATPDFSVSLRGALFQMTWAGATGPTTPAELPSPLSARDVLEMLALTAATEPGPFGPRTIEFGGYVGYHRDGRLVAMAGERMRLDGFAEISAVCVDPAFRGHGLAAELVKAVAAKIVARGETPFLHLFDTNQAAFALYRKLGFAMRREMHLTALARAA